VTEPAFTCPRCNRTSHHPEDALRFCGTCHAFSGEFPGTAQEQAEAWAARGEHLARLAREATTSVRQHDLLNEAQAAFTRAAQLKDGPRVREHAREEFLKAAPSLMEARDNEPPTAAVPRLTAERDEAQRLARHLAIRLALIRFGRVPPMPPGELQGAEAAMCKHAMSYPEEPDINAPAPWIADVANDGHECLRCHRVTPHAHEHDCAHGIAETHMAGTERWRCTACGHTTHAHQPGAERFRFVLDGKKGR
jgi:hypothetical protein